MAGFAVLLCDGFDGNFESRDGKAVATQVGTCIEIESRHPTFYVKDQVECR